MLDWSLLGFIHVGLLLGLGAALRKVHIVKPGEQNSKAREDRRAQEVQLAFVYSRSICNTFPGNRLPVGRSVDALFGRYSGERGEGQG